MRQTFPRHSLCRASNLPAERANHSLPAQAAGQGSGPGHGGATIRRTLGRAAQLEAVRHPGSFYPSS